MLRPQTSHVKASNPPMLNPKLSMLKAQALHVKAHTFNSSFLCLFSSCKVTHEFNTIASTGIIIWLLIITSISSSLSLWNKLRYSVFLPKLSITSCLSWKAPAPYEPAAIFALLYSISTQNSLAGPSAVLYWFPHSILSHWKLPIYQIKFIP